MPVVDVVDHAGDADLTPAVEVQPVRLDYSERGTVMLATPGSISVRIEARTASGAVAAFSNPAWVVKRNPPHPIPVGRRYRA